MVVVGVGGGSGSNFPNIINSLVEEDIGCTLTILKEQNRLFAVLRAESCCIGNCVLLELSEV